MFDKTAAILTVKDLEAFKPTKAKLNELALNAEQAIAHLGISIEAGDEFKDLRHQLSECRQAILSYQAKHLQEEKK